MKSKGFTFMELAAVLFVITLFFTLAIPVVRERGGAATEALKTASVLRGLSESAIARKKSYSITFDMDTKSARWEGPEGKKRMELKGLGSVTMPSTGEVRQGALTVFFDPAGPKEDLTVRISGGKGKSFRVVMSGLGGRVKVHEERKG
jgi:Tfp pilus assembly protein FimT